MKRNYILLVILLMASLGELDEKRKEVNLIYQKSVIAAFGRERALEIFKAARPK
jgi:hypothetical protein